MHTRADRRTGFSPYCFCGHQQPSQSKFFGRSPYQSPGCYDGRLARKGAKSDETPTHQSGTRESYTSADFVTRSSGCGRVYLGNTITMLRKMNCYPMLPGECGNENGQPRSRIGLIAWQREEFYVFARGPTDLALPVRLHRPTGRSAAAGTTKRTQFRCELLDPDR